MWLISVVMLVSGLSINAPHVDQTLMFSVTSHVTEEQCLVTALNVNESIRLGRPLAIVEDCHFDANYEQGVPLVDLEAAGAK